MARTAAMRSRRFWHGRSEKERFDMAYSTGFRKIELRLLQLTWVMYAVWEKMGAVIECDDDDTFHIFGE
jgi:hypothetical protein